ncbi:PREDICTED: translation machinery-associated protein 22-like isoform X1 [Lupinus angustifolius]|uniref:translation machinery-associated protein 22-like isoform X1 n=1 Tax=Lupinus angustifolius TaxID=3871 RepID=UPI00092F5613|nr:PREDICTED: translation machinery-associated protein 22-like isoform X1 [Lupinus angustifolius]
MAEKPQPIRVIYCPICSLPPEYCEFGSDFDKCKPWLIQNVPHIYPDLIKEANENDIDKVADKLQSTGISSGTSAAAATSASKQEVVKRLPGGKIKKKACLDRQEVVIEKVVRNKRKCITTVKGLELFGIKLSDASKKLGKKFATGASVVKGPTEKDQIDVQGDIAYDIVEFITDTWPDVPEAAIFFIEDGRKVPAA